MKQHNWWTMTGVLVMALIVAMPATAATAAPAEPSDPEAASRDLGLALRHYYDGEYARALPIFRNLAEELDTLDLMFWTGTSAARAGECELAMETLKQLLAQRPDLLRARLELGVTYERCGDPDRARAEFETVLAQSPPPEIRTAASSYLARIDEGRPTRAWRLRFSQGYQYDDNIAGGPDQDVIDDGDIAIYLDDGARKTSGDNWLTGLRGDFRHDLGPSGGLFWHGGLDFYYSHSFEDADYHYMKTDLFTGPYWAGRADVIQAPVGYTWKRYGGNCLSGTFHITPAYERRLTPAFGLGASYRLEVERYDDDRYTSAGYDNEAHTFSFGPNLYLMDRQYLISGRVAYELLDADADRHSFDAAHLSASVFTTLKTDTELFFRYKWTDRTYDGPAAVYSEDREDSRHTLVGVIAQNFLTHYFAALEIAYMKNNSNADIYDFDKTTVTLSVGLNY